MFVRFLPERRNRSLPGFPVRVILLPCLDAVLAPIAGEPAQHRPKIPRAGYSPAIDARLKILYSYPCTVAPALARIDHRTSLTARRSREDLREDRDGCDPMNLPCKLEKFNINAKGD